jgi:hypothetical protein
MPRYFFSFEGIPPEDDGVELDNDTSALAAAKIAAKDFAHNHSGDVPRIVIFNDAGELIRGQ